MSKSKIFLIAQSALCVLIAVLLSASALRIFLEGSAWQAAGHPSDWIYTREKAAGALAPILPLILASIVMTIIGLVKDIRDEDADKPVRDAEISRDLIAARVPQPSPEMVREQDLQKKLRIGGWIGFAVCMIPIFLYVTNAEHFAQTDAAGLDQNIVALIAFIVPWAIAGLACLVITTVLQEKSMLRETDAANAAIKASKAAAAPAQAADAAAVQAPGTAGAQGDTKAPAQVQGTATAQNAAKAPAQMQGTAAAQNAAKAPAQVQGTSAAQNAAKAPAPLNSISPETARRRILLRRVLMAAAVLFIVLGIFNGSMKDVLIKAIKICTECVGLG